MKNFKILFVFAIAILSIVSCTKENVEGPNTVDPVIPVIEQSDNPLVKRMANESSESSEAFELVCFTIGIPFELTIDGENVTIETIEDFETAMTDAVNNEAEAIDFVYPLTVSYTDGSTGEIANGEALGEAFATCVPTEGWDQEPGAFPAYVINSENNCYNLVYPLNLTDLDNNPVAVADEAAFIEALATTPALFFTFPLTLTNADGEEQTAQNDEELFELFFDCEGVHPPCDSLDFGGSGIACYGFSFPFDFTTLDADGNEGTVTINSYDDFNNSLLQGIVTGFAYPITLIDEDGNDLVVNSDDELNESFFLCEGVIPTGIEVFTFFANQGEFGGNCYLIQYPITVITNGTYTTVNNTQESMDIINGSSGLDLEYPVSVTLTEDNSTQVLENIDDLTALLNNCQ